MPADSQKQGRAQSGGQRIDDHSFWAGSKSKDSVFPDGPHKCKEYSSADSAGMELDYEDTTEKIRAQQEMAEKQVKKHPMKPLQRN